MVHCIDYAAFALLSTAGTIGGMSGAMIGGFFEPAGRVPFLGEIDLFKRKPYALPGLVLFAL